MSRISPTLRIALFSLCLMLAGCASTPREDPHPRDPWEGYNRAMFKFNDAVDQTILKPVAEGYEKGVPQPVRTGIGNFFSNLNDVVILFNNLLQLKGHDAASDLTRLIMNSTWGVFGIFDVATPMGLEKNNEDFGQTLGAWGVPSGPYLVLPLLGPSTLRDTPARVVDVVTSPLYYHDDSAQRNIASGVNLVHQRASFLATERAMEDMITDRYAALRDAYLQRRDYLVRDGEHDTQASEDMLRELEALEAFDDFDD